MSAPGDAAPPPPENLTAAQQLAIRTIIAEEVAKEREFITKVIGWATIIAVGALALAGLNEAAKIDQTVGSYLTKKVNDKIEVAFNPQNPTGDAIKLAQEKVNSMRLLYYLSETTIPTTLTNNQDDSENFTTVPITDLSEWQQISALLDPKSTPDIQNASVTVLLNETSDNLKVRSIDLMLSILSSTDPNGWGQRDDDLTMHILNELAIAAKHDLDPDPDQPSATKNTATKIAKIATTFILPEENRQVALAASHLDSILRYSEGSKAIEKVLESLGPGDGDPATFFSFAADLVALDPENPFVATTLSSNQISGTPQAAFAIMATSAILN